jgi:hypothetical protein
MEIETNLKLAQLPNALRLVAVLELLDLDKRNSHITGVPRGIDPPFRPDAILIQLLHSNEK